MVGHVVVYTAGCSGDCLHRVYYTVFEEEAAGCEGKDGERYIAVCIIDCLLEIYDLMISRCYFVSDD